MEQITPGIPRQKMNIIDILLLLLAVMLLLEFDRSLHPRAIGIDLYQYWGIGKVIRETDGKIRNPYTDYQDFNRILTQLAENTDDPAYQSVAEFRNDLELQGTPFSYFMFSWLPSEYNLTRVVYRYLQMGLFILTVSLLLQWAGYPWWRSFLAALLLLQVYYPMSSELGVGNFNTTLMAGLTGAIFIAGKLSSRPADDNGTVSTIFLAVLLLTWVGMFALMKPTLIAVVIAFQLFLLARFGIKLFMQANLLSIISVGLIAALPAIRFHSLNIWFEWFHYFKGGKRFKLGSFPFFGLKMDTAIRIILI